MQHLAPRAVRIVGLVGGRTRPVRSRLDRGLFAGNPFAHNYVVTVCRHIVIGIVYRKEMDRCDDPV